MKILVVDLETTGFFANSDLIVEIGIVLVNTETKKIELVFDHVVKDSRFNPIRHKDSWVFKNTTLKVSDVEKAQPISTYTKELQDLFDQYPMTAYNKRFDVSFLTAAGFKLNDIKCLMQTSKQYSNAKNKNGGKKVPSMEEIYNQFFMTEGQVYVEQHRAGADAMDEAKLLLHLVDLKSAKKNLVITE